MKYENLCLYSYPSDNGLIDYDAFLKQLLADFFQRAPTPGHQMKYMLHIFAFTI